MEATCTTELLYSRNERAPVVQLAGPRPPPGSKLSSLNGPLGKSAPPGGGIRAWHGLGNQQQASVDHLGEWSSVRRERYTSRFPMGRPLASVRMPHALLRLQGPPSLRHVPPRRRGRSTDAWVSSIIFYWVRLPGMSGPGKAKPECLFSDEVLQHPARAAEPQSPRHRGDVVDPIGSTTKYEIGVRRFGVLVPFWRIVGQRRSNVTRGLQESAPGFDLIAPGQLRRNVGSLLGGLMSL